MAILCAEGHECTVMFQMVISESGLLFLGIGRTGTFCTVDIALRRLKALQQRGAATTLAKQLIDIKQIVQKLRRQRCGMVQTKSQYLFCHEVSAMRAWFVYHPVPSKMCLHEFTSGPIFV
jgi:Protein-tyrosine phosphatase